MRIKNGIVGLAFVAAFSGFATLASAATVTASVNGTDNLYFTNWGSSNGVETGEGTAARAVADGGAAVNFGGLGTVSVTATGRVVDWGPIATTANGVAFQALYNGLTRYALIGVWSSTSGSVTAIGDSFVVGRSISLTAPLATTAYLFLGDNDGVFHDNSGAYSVQVSYQEPASVVPLPAALPMLGSAFGMIFLFGRRQRKNLG